MLKRLFIRIFISAFSVLLNNDNIIYLFLYCLKKTTQKNGHIICPNLATNVFNTCLPAMSII